MSKEKNVVIITGVLKSAFTNTRKNEDGQIIKETNVIMFSCEELRIDDNMEVWKFFDDFYKGKPVKWVPKWYKDKSGITLKSEYNVPVMINETGERFSFEEFVKRGLIRGAIVKVKCNVKESAIYPSAIRVMEDGEEYDAFSDF